MSKIALLNDLKTQCLAQLHSLPGELYLSPPPQLATNPWAKKLLYSKIISVAGKMFIQAVD